MRLEQTRFGVRFSNPVLLAAGTCGFGEELATVADLTALGGLVTKSVTCEPRLGNPAPRVAELPGAMMNSIGLANPGLEVVRRDKLPWIRENLASINVFVSVAGHTTEEYAAVVEGLDGEDGFLGFELNLSCPNDSGLGGLPFALDPAALQRTVAAVRRKTERPLLVKLAPNVPDIGAAAALAVQEGADGVTLINTMPGLVIDPETRLPNLGAGKGGLSGPALRAVGVAAVHAARGRIDAPIMGVGGITCAEDALQYILAGACLVQVGTASFADPRAANRIVEHLSEWGSRGGITDISTLIGAYGRVPEEPEEPEEDERR